MKGQRKHPVLLPPFSPLLWEGGGVCLVGVLLSLFLFPWQNPPFKGVALSDPLLYLPHPRYPDSIQLAMFSFSSSACILSSLASIFSPFDKDHRHASPPPPDPTFGSFVSFLPPPCSISLSLSSLLFSFLTEDYLTPLLSHVTIKPPCLFPELQRALAIAHGRPAPSPSSISLHPFLLCFPLFSFPFPLF
ncbi:hypothetical protein IE53DRAFT_169785 [Violaceomyces palustris]|uniref:Uncharacterized protein n=1 Tax=Violaceomyces palustris TaxID=1673888 RepID=A0ACD0NSY5_9BASI|nr:hypothetical protein IE53DRAFT_169785 [Violaceomyces palustris]